MSTLTKSCCVCLEDEPSSKWMMWPCMSHVTCLLCAVRLTQNDDAPPCPSCRTEWDPDMHIRLRRLRQDHRRVLAEQLREVDRSIAEERRRPQPQQQPAIQIPRAIPMCCARANNWHHLLSGDKRMVLIPNWDNDRSEWLLEFNCLGCNRCVATSCPVFQVGQPAPFCSQHGRMCLAVDFVRRERYFVCAHRDHMAVDTQVPVVQWDRNCPRAGWLSWPAEAEHYGLPLERWYHEPPPQVIPAPAPPAHPAPAPPARAQPAPAPPARAEHDLDLTSDDARIAEILFSDEANRRRDVARHQARARAAAARAPPVLAAPPPAPPPRGTIRPDNHWRSSGATDDRPGSSTDTRSRSPAQLQRQRQQQRPSTSASSPASSSASASSSSVRSSTSRDSVYQRRLDAFANDQLQRLDAVAKASAPARRPLPKPLARPSAWQVATAIEVEDPIEVEADQPWWRHAQTELANDPEVVACMRILQEISDGADPGDTVLRLRTEAEPVELLSVLARISLDPE